MKPLRILLPLFALSGAALGLSACNAGLSSDAAQVNTHSIPRGQLDAALHAIAKDPGFACVITGGNTARTVGAGDSYPAAFAAQILTTLIESHALDDRLAAERLATTPLAETVARAQLLQAFQPGQSTDQSCTTPAPTVLAGLEPSVRARLIALQADQNVLAAHAIGVELTTSGIAAWASAHPHAATLTCVDLAPFPSSAAAGSFITAVRKGTAFVAAAGALGSQVQSGCVAADSLPAGLGPALDALGVGQLSAAIPYSGSYLVFQVTRRSPVHGEHAAELLLQSTASRVSGIVAAALSAAQVHVNPIYGRWAKVSSGWQVVPPSGPPAQLLINPAAVGVSGTTGTALPGAG